MREATSEAPETAHLLHVAIDDLVANRFLVIVVGELITLRLDLHIACNMVSHLPLAKRAVCPTITASVFASQAENCIIISSRC